MRLKGWEAQSIWENKACHCFRGEMIWPASVERALSGLSWVKKRVVGNRRGMGRVVTAFVVPRINKPISLEQTERHW